MDSEAPNPAVSAMEPEVEAGPRRKTPERRLVWRRMRLLLGCLTASADLLVDELPVDEVDLMKRGQWWVPEPLTAEGCCTSLASTAGGRAVRQVPCRVLQS